MVTGLNDLETIAADFPTAGNYAERSFEGVQALSAEDVSDVETSHGYNFLATLARLGSCINPAHSLAEHVGLFQVVDQTVIEPASPVYERTIVEGGDCFPTGDCATMLSENDVQRKNILVDTEHQILPRPGAGLSWTMAEKQLPAEPGNPPWRILTKKTRSIRTTVSSCGSQQTQGPCAF